MGQKVICVDDSGYVAEYGETTPVKGKTYTIRDIRVDPADSTKTCFRLREIVNPPQQYASGLTECSFRADRFTAVKGKPGH